MEHRIAKWEKKYGQLLISRKAQQRLPGFFPEGEFTLVAFGEILPNRSFGRKFNRLYVGKPLTSNPKIVEGSMAILTKTSEAEIRLNLKGTESEGPLPPMATSLHEKLVQKWKEEQKTKFGPFTPEVSTPANINKILPESIHLKENTKTVDGFSTLKIGELPVYKSVLEVQDKGVREDTVVRLALIVPFIDHIDLVAEIDDLEKMKELLERLVDANIVKTRVYFHTFTEYLRLK
jgi:hypothetical protein